MPDSSPDIPDISVAQRVDTLLSDTDKSLIEVYLDIQKECEQQYGEDTVVFMEVGSFFEVYGVDNATECIGKPKEVAEILNVQLTRKNKAVLENSVSNPLLAGFPSASFERYINRLIQEQQYTIVLIRQKGNPPKITRFLDRIISPGVNFDYALDHSESMVASILLDYNNGLYSVGYTAADITTGKIVGQEVHSTSEDPYYAIDQLFQLLRSHHVAESVVTPLSDEIDIQEILQYIELQESEVRIHEGRQTVAYQNTLFTQTFSIESSLSGVEFLHIERLPLLSESLATLIEFVVEHDVAVAHRLRAPEIIDPQRYLYLGNNPLEQLNIISRDPDELTILKLIDYTTTAIGRRLLRERVLHPITDGNELEERYTLVEQVRPLIDDIRGDLRGLYDIERLLRRIHIQRLHPFEINFLYDSFVSVGQIIERFESEQKGSGTEQSEHRVITELVDKRHKVQQCIQHIDSVFDLQQSAQVHTAQIARCFFQRGQHAELDALLEQEETLMQQMDAIRLHVIAALERETGKSREEIKDYVEIKQLDKDGHYIHLTKNRYQLIADTLQESTITNGGAEYAFSELTVKVQTTTVKILGGRIDELSEEIVLVQKKITALTKELYEFALQAVDQQFGELIATVVTLIGQVDVALSTARCSQELGWNRPEIVATDNTTAAVSGSFIELRDIRHPLVERREDNGIYVPNTVIMGNKQLVSEESEAELLATLSLADVRGMLLYGINASGKSSLMKSVGIAVLLAQSGYFVPATAMRFVLFKEVFTRIVEQDQFDRGLSSFGVEMMELKNIFNRATNRSLILGDEISHGTETLSAIAIVSAAIARLEELGGLFILTTHLHQLHDIPVMQETKHVASVHLAIHYDEDADTVVFDRKLQEGSGSSMYGLEFAQSLHMDKRFLDLAMNVRKELAHNYDDMELLTKKQKSKYNTDLYLTSCAVCSDTVDDTHHIRPQQEANKDGRIDHFHKDHKWNLIPLCKKCHQKVHHGKLHIRGFVMTTNGLQLQYEDEKSESESTEE